MAIQQAAKGGFEGFSLFRIQNTYGKQFYVDFPNQPGEWGLTNENFGSALDQYEYWLFEKSQQHTLNLTQPGVAPFSNQIIIYDRALDTVLDQFNLLATLSVNFTPTEDLYWVILN